MIHKNFVACAITLGLASVGLEARADDWFAYVRQAPGKPFPTVHVYSDEGTSWDRVGDIEEGLTFNVDARGTCREHWHTSPSSTLGVYTIGLVTQASLNIDIDDRSYGPGNGAAWKLHEFKGPYVKPGNHPAPVEMCNALLEEELVGAANPTQRRKEILAGGITRTLEHSYQARFNLACGFDNIVTTKLATAQLSAKLICHGNPAALNVPDPPAHRVKHDDGIHYMDIWANPSSSANYTGYCPKKITFGGEVEYKVLPGRTVNLKYRYVATSGARVIKSDYYTTVYDSTARKVLHSWGLDFPLQTGGPQIAAPTNSGEPSVYGGNVVLEFVGAVPYHANLQPVEFKVTCLKQGVVNPAVAGAPNTIASSTAPRETVHVSPQPPAQPKAMESSNAASNSAATLAKPDLTIRSAAPASGSDVVLLVNIANLGTAPSTATQVTMFLPDGKPVRAQLRVVPAGGTLTVRLTSPMSLTGMQLLRLRVDDPDRVAETNETNNEYSLRR